jgi:uncharacterized peroxidase-related enzyme
MPHISLPADAAPGISGLLVQYPDTGRPLRELVEALLRGPSTLSQGERELIASSVSWWNDCRFCHTSHGAAAAASLGCGLELIDDIKAGLQSYPASPKLRALLAIARQVQQGGRHVAEATVAAARDAGATDREIHDTVLIAAACGMFNRYVDGLATSAPDANEAYRAIGEKMARHGYLTPYRSAQGAPGD